MLKFARTNRGFTLIELLVVIGIIAILAAVVIIAINPARQFAEARNSQRQANIDSILNAIGQNLADNKGIFGGICTVALPKNASTSIMNGSGSVPSGVTPTATLDLSCLAPTYIANFPADPSKGAPSAAPSYTGYEINTDSTGRVMICAPYAAESSIAGSTGICVVR